ncbi:MAG TPA: ATP-binding protein, partial [Anaerolineales bacterium]|nr:ATP-binding protein [Anaerolineales bacterium]
MAKTEIDTIDGTPDKRMFWSIISDYDLATSLAELIDNAIDTWSGTADRPPLTVDLDLDTDRQIIRYTDNAGGVLREDLRLLVAPGGSKNAPDGASIGIFGVGSKRAVVALAEHVVIRTRHLSEVDSHQVEITKHWLEAADWELPVYRTDEIQAGSMRIELSQLRRTISADEVPGLIEHFESTYGAFIEGGRFTLTVNGKALGPRSFDAWAFPPEFPPRQAKFQVTPDGRTALNVEVTAGLIRDRDPELSNYGVYIYCNDRLVVRDLKDRSVGYYVTSEAGVPHPDASLCRVIVRLNGPAILMPWNSSKTGVNTDHATFHRIRPTIIQLTRHFSSLSRRFKDDWEGKVLRFDGGTVAPIPPEQVTGGRKLVLPELPKVQKPYAEKVRARNRERTRDLPWTIGLVESITAVDLILRQKLETRNRIALILLDSAFEIALKEYITHNAAQFPNVN